MAGQRVSAAVVTGGGRGLRPAIAIELAGAGFDLVLGYGKQTAEAPMRLEARA
jgi:NAD(P)-dependent dehydrogenase (short-subunit alcohol dehydrogenase family)